jgi:hypothetical protein
MICLGFALAAEAQDAGGTSMTLPEVSVSAQADRAFFAPDTASEGVVTGKQIEEQPRSRVGEVLEIVPGLIATQHSAEGKANQYFLRGFNLDHGTDIDITLDDMPVNMRTHGHGQGYADLNFMVPELIGTLHYSKGPYFPDLGDFDTAGAVQINYVDSLPHDLALATAGNFGYYRGLGTMSRPAGAGNLLAAAEYVHANGPWTIPDNYNKGNLVLNYSQGNLDNGFSFTGMYMNDAFHATNQIPHRAVTEGLICLYCPFDPTDGGSSERYSVSTRYAAGSETGQLNANAYLIGYQLQLFNNFDGFVTFPPPIGDQFIQQDRRKIYGGNVSYMMPGNILGYDVRNTIGLQTRTDDIHIDLAETTSRAVRFTVRDVLGNDRNVYACDRPNSRIQVFDRGCGGPSTADNPEPMCQPKKIINIGLNAGQTPPSNVPVVGNNAFQNATPEDAAAILGSLTTRSSDIDFWPNIDYLATKSPTSQNTIVNVDLNNDNVWLIDKATATVFDALGVCGIIACPGHNAGHFAFSHTAAVDSKGNIYVAETITGRRIQKFVQVRSGHRY